ncbi:DUF3108 domain-containing protein [Rheinheimera sp.]|uniref:DUF3108 domain-containing protein n=1 Tax=Rheinheimera sp. TaxID=1869214 RepID=UPI00307E4C18
MTRTMTKWRFIAPFFLLLTPLLLQAEEPAPAQSLTLFDAKYDAFRSGKKLGEAKRYLKQTDSGYELGYSSDVSFLIFDDKRSETSWFVLQQGRVQPQRYLMQRTGTGKDRYYELNLDWSQQQLLVGKKRQPKTLPWNAQWLDALGYQTQLVLDLKAGKTDFVYQVLNRDGNEREYHYKKAAEELVLLPYGKLKTIRIERTEKDKQVLAWVAPELDYLLVRLWQAEDGVEQFDIQLSELNGQTGSPK